MKAPNVTAGEWTTHNMDHTRKRTDPPDDYRQIQGGCGHHDPAFDEPGFGVTGFITAADAKMLAAAPMLAEALNDLMEMRSKCFIPNDNDWWDEKARAALLSAGYTEE